MTSPPAKTLSVLKPRFYNAPFFLFIAVFCSFFILPTSQHRVLLYITALSAIFLYKNALRGIVKSFFNDFRFLSIFLIYAFTVSVFSSVGSLYLLGESVRLILLPFLFIITSAAVLNTQERWEKMLNFFLITAMISAFIAAIQFYGFDDNTLLNPAARYRGFGRLMNPNIAGYFYGLSFILMVTQLTHIKHSMLTLIKNDTLKTAVALIPAVLFACILYATGSRNALLATTFSCGALLLFQKKYKILCAVVCLSAAAFLVVINSGVAANLIERGGSHRIEVWLQAIEYFKQKPLFGHGYQIELTYTLKDFPAFKINSAHNFVLGLLTQTGIIGACLFMAFFIRFFSAVMNAARTQNTYVILMILTYSACFSLFEMNSIFTNLNYQYVGLFVPIAFMLSLQKTYTINDAGMNILGDS